MDKIYEAIVALNKQGGEAVLVTVVAVQGSTPARLGGKMLVQADGRTLGTVGGGGLEKAATARALEVLARQQGEMVRYALTPDDRALDSEPSGMICGGHVTLFYDYLGQGPHVYVYGGGHVGQAMARQLRDLPYYVTIIDHRPEMAAAIEGADRILTTAYETALQGETVPPGSFFLIATPSHEFDYVALKRIMTSAWKPAYVGMLGSLRKVRITYERLRGELGDQVNWDILYCPVGLNIGGPTPAEIAVSVAAEMQAVRYGRMGHLHMRLEGAGVGGSNPQAINSARKDE